MEIRELEYEDLEEASKVLWKSFYEAEKHNFSLRGMEKVRDATSPVSLSMSTVDGMIALYGAFENGALCGVGALRRGNHVLLLYVRPDHWRRGFGSALLRHMEELCAPGRITVNSSDPAVPFYEAHGYAVTGPRRVEDDYIFTPMEKYKPVPEGVPDPAAAREGRPR